jgi:hypothetical protein
VSSSKLTREVKAPMPPQWCITVGTTKGYPVIVLHRDTPTFRVMRGIAEYTQETALYSYK